MTVVIGLDLSLSCTGLCACPVDWGGDWSRVTVSTAGVSLKKDASEKERAGRLTLLREAVMHFARRTGATSAVLEQYAMGPAGVRHSFSLGELGGVVKVALDAAGIEIESVSPQAARKLLGKQPKKDRKIWAAHRLVSMGAPAAWPMDCLDAFALCNYKLAELGVGLIAPETAA